MFVTSLTLTLPLLVTSMVTLSRSVSCLQNTGHIGWSFATPKLSSSSSRLVAFRSFVASPNRYGRPNGDIHNNDDNQLPNEQDIGDHQVSRNDPILPSSSYSSSIPDRVHWSVAEQQRKEWIDRSVAYYSKVMREERRRKIGQVKAEEVDSADYQDSFMLLAKKHYFALRKIKDGKWQHAESIYRKIIDELLAAEEQDKEECDHAKLAVTTLLLALLLQRMNDPKKTRAVFLNFFRVVALAEGEEQQECACSAKVLQAFALFEMKQGNALKSLQIVQKAIQLDPSLHPVLQWKQFREQQERWQARARLREQRLSLGRPATIPSPQHISSNISEV